MIHDGSARFARHGEVRLCYEVMGPASAPPVLLVMGLNLSLPWWRDELCASLVDRGFRVVRMDNRDVGLSSRLVGPGPSALGFLLRRARPTYALEDMADDCAAVLAEVGPAHVVGVSLGSFVAQQVAIRHPALTRSLVSIMGRPGDGRTGKVAPSMLLELLRPPSGDPVESLVRSFRRIGSTFRTAEDDEDVRRVHRASLLRSPDESGGGRQLAAILTETDRTPGLHRLSLPALVVHGTHDRIVRPSGGEATAAAIPGAELEVVEGMGHDLARAMWPRLLDGISRTASRAT